MGPMTVVNNDSGTSEPKRTIKKDREREGGPSSEHDDGWSGSKGVWEFELLGHPFRAQLLSASQDSIITNVRRMDLVKKEIFSCLNYTNL